MLVPNFGSSAAIMGPKLCLNCQAFTSVSSDWSLYSLCFQSNLTFASFCSFSFLSSEKHIHSTSSSCHALRLHIYYLNISIGFFWGGGLLLLDSVVAVDVSCLIKCTNKLWSLLLPCASSLYYRSSHQMVAFTCRSCVFSINWSSGWLIIGNSHNIFPSIKSNKKGGYNVLGWMI